MMGRRNTLAAGISIVATVALGVSVYLTWVTWQAGTVAGCTADSLLDCDEVLTSRWSKWLGLPVSLFGTLIYSSLLAVCWPAAWRWHRLAPAGLFALALLAAGAAVWFVGLQAIHLQSFCFYCLTIHACGLGVGVLAYLLFVDSSESSADEQRRSLLGVTTVDPDIETVESRKSVSVLELLGALTTASVGLAALMGGQLLSESSEIMHMEEIQPLASPSSEIGKPDKLNTRDEQEQGDFVIVTDQPTEDSSWIEKNAESTAGRASLEPLFDASTRHVAFSVMPTLVDVKSMPMVGNPEAKHVMLEMMDYTCKHCRELHPHLRATLDHYGDQLALVIYHVPLSKKCNAYVQKDGVGKKNACDYAQLALGVWKLAPEKFPEFHDWLLESEKPPNVVLARKRAMSLVGNGIFIDKKMRADVKKRISNQCSTLHKIRSSLPALLLSNGAIRGVPDQSEKLFLFLESKLDIQPLNPLADE